MLSDLRFAFRALLRNRKFTLVVVLTLAVGIGSATSIFSVTDWILFRATKFPNDVFLIGGHNDQTSSVPVRFDFMARAYAEQSQAMSEYAKAVYMTDNIVLDGHPVASNWLGVTSNLFPLLGIAPRLGRNFLPGEEIEGANQVVIVSHSFWVQHLGAREDALGKKLRVGNSLCTVVGVLREAQNLPPYFFYDVFRPLTYHYDPALPWTPSLFLLGKLRPGFTRDQAAQALASVKVEVPPALRPYMTNDHAILSSMTEVNNIMHVEIYWVLFGAVGFLYAIACLNASNLMLVRMLGQRRELSIRLALGGGRGRIIRTLVIDSVILAFLASLVGVVVANWLFPLLLSAAGNAAFMSNGTGWGLNWRVLGVLGILTIITTVLIVIVPAFQIFRADIQSGLKDGGGALGESRALARLRGTFVIFQTAFAVVLLSGAGLMINTFHRLEKVDLGFDPVGRVKVQINFPVDYPSGWEPRLARLHEIQAELKRIPGVRAVGFGQDVLLPGFDFAVHTLEGPGDIPLRASMAGINIGFQEASGLTLKQGKWMNQVQGNEIMVNESFAHARWPGQNAIGQLVRPVAGNPGAPADWKGWLVVGVVGNVRSTLRDVPGLYIYTPEGWSPSNFNTFVLRLSQNYDEALVGTLRRNLYAFDPRLVVSQVLSLDQSRNQQLWAERLADSVLKVLAGIALALTIIGVFSVLAYTVDRRMGEFGVRMALGATRKNLMQLVMRRGLTLTLIGFGLGVSGALGLTRYLQSLLFETSAQDPWIFAVVGGMMLLTSFLACAFPSLRATKVDVSRLLRSE